MNIENVNNRVNQISQFSLRSDSTQPNQQNETFSEIFQQSLNNGSNSRPPKIELTGILVPCDKVVYGRRFVYKLETESDEYLLSMSNILITVARKVEWENVSVRGRLNFEENFFEVEKIRLIRLPDSVEVETELHASYSHKDLLEKELVQKRPFEPPGYLSS